MTTKGLSLIEVLIAVAVLGIGVLAAAALQQSSLSASSSASITREATRFAESELELQKAGVASTCLTTESLPEAYDCQVDITTCSLQPLGVSCDNSMPVVADLVRVTISAPRDTSVALATVVRR